MIPFDSLDKIARIVAAQSHGLDFDDTYQQAHLRFLLYPPRTKQGAWTMARHARNDLWRRERVRRHTALSETLHYSFDDEVMARMTLQRLRELMPEAVEWLLQYRLRRMHTNAEKVRAHRLRKRLRALVKGA